MDKPVHATEHFFTPKTGSELFQQILLEHEFEIELGMLKKEQLQPRREAVIQLLEAIHGRESFAAHSS